MSMLSDRSHVELPKPLLPLGGVPLMSRWVEDLHEAGVSSQDIFVVTNAHFHDQFVSWAGSAPGGQEFPVDNIVNDGMHFSLWLHS